MTRGAYLADDPKTILVWCRASAVAHSTLKKRCEAVDVTPKDSLDFTRLLRVVIRHACEPWDLLSWLDIVDGRTERSLRERAGFRLDCSNVPGLESFLSTQRLIVRSELVEAIRSKILPV